MEFTAEATDEYQAFLEAEKLINEIHNEQDSTLEGKGLVACMKSVTLNNMELDLGEDKFPKEVCRIRRSDVLMANSFSTKEGRTIHIYPQIDPHDNVTIAGDREALLILKRTIEEALTKGQATSEVVYAKDGEGYQIVVQRIDEPEEWFGKFLPYVGW